VSDQLDDITADQTVTSLANTNNQLTEIVLPSSQALEQAVRRPVFEQMRKPFAPKLPPVIPVVVEPVIQQTPTPMLLPEPQPQPAPLPFELSLKGVFKTQTRDQALIISPEQPSGKWYATGEVVGGWKISRILEAGVKFELAGETRELKLYVDNPANSLAPAQ
jgi:type II secretory pathway component PulC